MQPCQRRRSVDQPAPLCGRPRLLGGAGRAAAVCLTEKSAKVPDERTHVGWRRVAVVPVGAEPSAG